MPTAYAIFSGTNHLIEHANDAALKLFGKTPAIIGKPLLEAIPELKGQAFATIPDLVHQSGKTHQASESLVYFEKEGTLCPVYVSFVWKRNQQSKQQYSLLFVANDITEQVISKKNLAQIEQQLTASELRFRNTVLQAPVGIAILRGADFVFEIVNKAYLYLIEKSEAETVGKPLFECLPEVRPVVEPLLTGVMETGIAYHAPELEVKLKRPGKSDNAFFNLIYEPLREADGRISGIMVVANEVTQQVDSRYMLMQSEQQFRKVVMDSPIAMTILKGSDFIIEMANDTMFKNIWRRSEEELIGKSILEAFPELEQQQFPDLLRSVVKNKKTYRENEAIAYVEGNDGMKKFYLDFEYAPIFDTSGEVSGIIITVYDVTSKVELRQQIAEFADRLQMATEGTSLATWDLDLSTQRIFHSPQLAEFFGHDKQTKLTHADIRAQIHPEDRGIVENAFENALASGTYHYEARVVRPDQTSCWIRTSGKVYYDESGKAVRMLGTMMDITGQRTQDENNSRLAAIVQSTSDAIIAVNLERKITNWNASAERIFGYSAQEIIGLPINTLIPDELWQQEDEIFETILNNELIGNLQTTRKHKNGSLLDISLSISPIRDGQGNIVAISKIARDVSRQKKIERLITDNEEKLKIVLEASELGTWELVIGNDHIRYSPRFLYYMGYRDGDSPSHEALKQRLHPDDRLARDKAFEMAIASGRLNYSSRVVWPDGSLHWVEIKGKVLYDDQAKPVKMIGSIRDLTDEKRRQQKIEESELKFRLLADSMPQLIWTGDIHGSLTYFNNSVYDYCGLTHQDMIQHGWLQIVHPDEREENEQLWREAIEKGTDFLFEHRFRNRHGDYRWHLSRATPQRDSKGAIQMWVGASTDIHDQKTFARNLELKVQERTHDLQQANQELKRMNEELASFAYVSSHDLQEPLRKIQTFANRIEEKEVLSDSGRDYFRRMQDAAQRMHLLIEDLLAYSRTSTTEKIFEETDLNELLNGVKQDLEQPIREKQAVIECEQLPLVRIIPFQFRQLFTNIISNALKFSKQDVPSHIRITCQQCSGAQAGVKELETNRQYYHISVADNGIGFSPEYSSRIFEVFQRLHGKHEYKGTGIGLAICKKIMENHQGCIWASSLPGEGATFHLYIPA